MAARGDKRARTVLGLGHIQQRRPRGDACGRHQRGDGDDLFIGAHGPKTRYSCKEFHNIKIILNYPPPRTSRSPFLTIDACSQQSPPYQTPLLDH